ncbi:MAG TPA: hypothetical protein PKN13_04755 [Accumulibacter sp.]|nr:hypothetical protein [Accumulibacter sp.]HNC17278.1 hypothetical protein [Accumulibacter sp.]HND79828.1 hypothetical protein [Accumulibacter sp.]HNM74639.1 hypothetical protein [Accumulibacter sp.]
MLDNVLVISRATIRFCRAKPSWGGNVLVRFLGGGTLPEHQPHRGDEDRAKSDNPKHAFAARGVAFVQLTAVDNVQ